MSIKLRLIFIFAALTIFPVTFNAFAEAQSQVARSKVSAFIKNCKTFLTNSKMKEGLLDDYLYSSQDSMAWSVAYLAAEMHPHFMGQFDYYTLDSRRQGIRFSGTLKINAKMDQHIGTKYELPFRFKDWIPGPQETNTFPNETMLKALLENHVLLAIDSNEFIHDRLDDHIVGQFLIPSEVFQNFKSQIRIIFELRKYFEIQLHWNKVFQSEIDSLARRWDATTSLVGQMTVETRPFSRRRASTAFYDLAMGQSLKYENVQMNWSHRLIRMLSAEHPLTEDEIAHVNSVVYSVPIHEISIEQIMQKIDERLVKE